MKNPTVVRVPSLKSISSAEKIPSTTRALIKSLSRLSRTSLIHLALKWLQPHNQPLCAPYLSSTRNLEEEAEEDYLYEPSENIEELRKRYERLEVEGGTKRDVIDRILDGDWRRGITLHQLALIDFQHLSDYEGSLRWFASKLVPLNATEDEEAEPLKVKEGVSVDTFPRIHSSTFLQALQREISPLVKAHYHFQRLNINATSLTILRLLVADTPYATSNGAPRSHFTDGARTLFIAFPDSCSYYYIALNGSGGFSKHSGPKMDVAALKRIVVEAVPKALSKPQQRYSLENSALTARRLSTMCELRGNGRGGASGGAYSIFLDSRTDDSPLSVAEAPFSKKVLTHEKTAGTTEVRPDDPAPPQENISRGKKRKVLVDKDTNVQVTQGNRDMKRRRVEAARRFGTTGVQDSEHKAPIDRLQIRIDEMLSIPDDEQGQDDPDASSSPKTSNVPLSLVRTSYPKEAPRLGKLDSQSANQSVSNPAHARTSVTVIIHGIDVFAGLRKLAENGKIDMDKMPAWMTGEENVSNGVVMDGSMVNGRGGGATW